MLNRKVDNRENKEVKGFDNIGGVYEILKKRDFQPWRIEVKDAPAFQKDLALVLCHYGQDDRRIKAIKTALEWTLQSNPRPAKIVFVEAHDVGEPLHFDYLVGQNIQYFTRVIPEQGKGIWLKEALWSIGGREAIKDAAISKLILLDADCEFVKQNWSIDASEALNEFDVISPHSFGYYSNQPDAGGANKMPKVTESSGYKAMNGASGGFPGFSLGMTREFFENRLGSRIWLSSNGGGDTLFWQLVRGIKNFGNLCAHYSFTFDMRRGIQPKPKVGSAGLLLCHQYHGPFSERGYYARAMITIAATELPMSEYKYLDNGMPVWNIDLPGGRIMSKVYPEYRKAAIELKDKADTKYARGLYDVAAEEEYGKIDADNPLVVACLLRSGGVYTAKHVQVLKKQFDEHCKTPFRFVCMSDISIDGIETIPLSLSNNDCPGWWGQVEYFQKGVFDENTSVLTCDLDNVVLNDFTMHQCPKGEFFSGREIGARLKAQWSVWNFGVTYWRGDFSCVFNKYVGDLNHPHLHPAYQHISVQEFVYDTLRSSGVYTKDVEAHIMTRFFNGLDKMHPAGTVILQFPDHPKPWELVPAPEWMPSLEI